MDKEIAKAALISLSRSELKAVEIGVFMEVRAALEREAHLVPAASVPGDTSFDPELDAG